MTGKLPFSANVAALELHQGLDLSASHATVMKQFAAALQDAYDRGAEDAARSVLPEGSVVVPREPTDAMSHDGAHAVLDTEGPSGAVAVAVYRAMIAAATEDAR